MTARCRARPVRFSGFCSSDSHFDFVAWSGIAAFAVNELLAPKSETSDELSAASNASISATPLRLRIISNIQRMSADICSPGISVVPFNSARTVATPVSVDTTPIKVLNQIRFRSPVVASAAYLNDCSSSSGSSLASTSSVSGRSRCIRSMAAMMDDEICCCMRTFCSLFARRMACPI